MKLELVLFIPVISSSPILLDLPQFKFGQDFCQISFEYGTGAAKYIEDCETLGRKKKLLDN